eukprot:1148355-Pelagomonas_calceolata.AAC.7
MQHHAPFAAADSALRWAIEPCGLLDSTLASAPTPIPPPPPKLRLLVLALGVGPTVPLLLPALPCPILESGAPNTEPGVPEGLPTGLERQG